MQTRKQMPRAGQCAFPQGTVLPRLLDAHIMIMHTSPCLETVSIEASLVRSYRQLYICAAITTASACALLSNQALPEQHVFHK